LVAGLTKDNGLWMLPKGCPLKVSKREASEQKRINLKFHFVDLIELKSN